VNLKCQIVQNILLWYATSTVLYGGYVSVGGGDQLNIFFGYRFLLCLDLEN